MQIILIIKILKTLDKLNLGNISLYEIKNVNKRLKKNKPGGKIEYMSNNKPPKTATNKAYIGKKSCTALSFIASISKTIIKTKIRDICFENKDHEVCKITSKKIKKINRIILKIVINYHGKRIETMRKSGLKRG